MLYISYYCLKNAPRTIYSKASKGDKLYQFTSRYDINDIVLCTEFLINIVRYSLQ